MNNAIIVDLDGTIAKKGDRDIYDYSKVHLDTPIKPVVEIIRSLINDYDIYTDIIYVSGREEMCRKQTLDWIYLNVSNRSTAWSSVDLFMRPTGDNRCDTIIKREIYDNHIKDKYNVIAVFDDRPKVIRMWRSLGLFVFNCCQHDEEF